MIVYWLSQQWPTDVFWSMVGAAEDIASREVPTADIAIIRRTILKEWLEMSYPAGKA